MATIRYLGHAGFVASHAGHRLLMDPWFFPAFLDSWFPYPDNRDLLDVVTGQRYDHLYVSHAHEDHFDPELLRRLDRSTPVIVAKYRSKVMVKRFRELGFTDVTALAHKESLELAPGCTVTMYLDTSHKEDSGLLVDMGGFRFLDLNDCNTPMSELPDDVDLLAAQYSGAMWYPNCYDYPPQVMSGKVAQVCDDLMDTLYRKVRITNAKAYLPSAGPACFLDPELAEFNDRDATIFPVWEQKAAEFAAACPEVPVIRVGPGDEISTDVGSDTLSVNRHRPREVACPRTSTRTESGERTNGSDSRPGRSRPSRCRRSRRTSTRCNGGTSASSAISARTSGWWPARTSGRYGWAGSPRTS